MSNIEIHVTFPPNASDADGVIDDDCSFWIRQESIVLIHPILIGGNWVASHASRTFQATNPQTAEAIAGHFPVSSWADCEFALEIAASAFDMLRELPSWKLAEFLEHFADRLTDRSIEICELAHLETGLPLKPRLLDGELPRTTDQLRQAASAARLASWCRPTIDTARNIRSIHAGLGPVAVFGPNNFPLAFGSISGGDFAAAIAAGNPVIAKANSSHPGTTRLLAVEAQKAADECSMPVGIVQLLYRLDHADGVKLVRDPRLAAIAYTGSRQAGLRLKEAADTVGKPAYLELSSINPVIILPGAIVQRGDQIADELLASCLLGTGQFCTSPGLVLLFANADSEAFINRLATGMVNAANGVLLSKSVLDSLVRSVEVLIGAGGESVCGGAAIAGNGFRYANTLLKTDADTFLSQPAAFQTEAFGNATLCVLVDNQAQACQVVQSLDGNLTGSIYSDRNGDDDGLYHLIEPHLRQRVGRLLNDAMPTGVAVSPAMNHGGPFPATGHPGFTAVGIPNSMIRFSMLQCYEKVRENRLPENLRDENPNAVVRLVDGHWTRKPLGIPN